MKEYLEIIKDRIDYYKNDPRVMIDNDNFIFIQSIEKLLYEYQKEKRENEDLKNRIEKYLKEEQERFEVYKKESETNEDLKLGMYKHLGGKNMCEKILGIEKNIATLDKEE